MTQTGTQTASLCVFGGQAIVGFARWRANAFKGYHHDLSVRMNAHPTANRRDLLVDSQSFRPLLEGKPMNPKVQPQDPNRDADRVPVRFLVVRYIQVANQPL